METKTTKEVKTWTLDPVHSSIHFAVRHMVISEIKGLFETYKLNVKPGKNDFAGARIDLEIDVNSISTNMTDRDNHLRSPEFFDAAQFPVIKFTSTSFEKIDEESYRLAGNLTIKDISRPVEFRVSYGGQAVDPWGNLRAGFKVEGNINRFDFGLSWNALLETGGAVVGKNVKIEASVELVASK